MKYPSFRLYITILIFLSPLSYALENERIAPRLPEKQAEGQLIGLKVPKVISSENRNQTLIPYVKGLVFVNKIEEIQASRTDVTGIDASAITQIDASDLVNLLADYLGQPLSLATLDQINQDISLHFRRQGYTVVDSIVPSNQDITEGVIQFILVIGKMGQLTVEGGEYFSAENVRHSFSHQQDDLLKTESLKSDLDWLNNNPFRSVNLVLQAGKDVGQTDVKLTINDRKPYRLYVGLEDTGTELTGDNRWLMGANIGNLFDLEHQFNYQYISSLGGAYLTAHSINYVAPLPWRHTLSVSTSKTISTPKSALPGFNLKGETKEFSLDYKIPIASVDALTHDISVGYQFKYSNNNLDFGQNTVFNNFTEVSQFSLNYHVQYNQPNNANSLTTSLVLSPGGMTDKNNNNDFNASRPLASADYHYLAINANHSEKIFGDITWNLQIKAQISSGNLLGSEQMGIGGRSSVRGYDEYSLVGDSGFLIRSEWQTKAYPLLSTFTSLSQQDQLQWLGFFEGGIVKNIDEVANESSQSITSVGLGLRYQLENYVSIRMDYGWQLKELAGQDQNNRLHFGVMINF